MALPDVTLANGTGLYISNDGITYNEVVDTESMSGVPAPKAAEVDATPLKPTNNTRFQKKGLKKNSEFTFKQFWNKTRKATMVTYEASATDLYFRVTYPDNANPLNASKHEFRGFINDHHDEGFNDADDPILIAVAVTVTTFPTFTQGS